MGLCCQAMHSSFSLATIILVHIFVRLDKLAGGSKFRSLKRVLMDLTYPRTMADQELWSSMSCSMKHAMTLWYHGLLPHGSWMQCLLAKFNYTACLNLVVSTSESDLSLDIFLSTICPRADRLACDSAGRNCKLSAPYAPVEGWRSRRYRERRMIWNLLMLVFSALISCQGFCSRP
jgi:hypothetical protein